MEDLSYHYSPKVRQFMSTQTTDVTSRFSTGCNFCPGTPTYQKDDLTVTDLKREYSKAMNCIEILKLEKKNLQDALSLTKDFKKDKTEKFFVSSTSTRATNAVSPRAEFRPVVSLESERKMLELEQELLEHRRLLDKSLAHNELLRKENYSYKERLQEVDNLQLQNHALKNNLKELTEELKLQTQKNYELEDEKDQLIERRTQINNSSRKLPPRELYKYLDHVYELVGSLNKNHYANYHFRECFIDEANIETLIEEKETNQVLVQSFRYITNLLMNIKSSAPVPAPAIEQRRPSNTLFTESGSDNQRKNNNVASYNNTGHSNNVEYTEDEADIYSPHPTANSNVSKNLNFNGMSREIEVEPHSFGESKPLSQQNLSPERYVQSNNSNVRGHSPANSRNMITNNSYSHKANTDINSKRELSRNTSYKSGISVTSPKTRDRSPSNKSAAADRNAAVNVSKQSIARSHVSQRQNTGTEANNQLNASRHSQGKSAVSHHTANVRDADAVNVSRYSQKNYPTHHSIQQNNEEDYVLERSGNGRNITQELGDKEMRLRELDRELKEKDRLLQLREKELKDKSVMDRSTARYRAQEEAEVNRSNISQSRKLASQKSMTKDQSAHQSRQRIDDSRMGKSQTQIRAQSQLENERTNNNLNKSNSGIQSRIIPSITSLNDMDASPKVYGTSPKHSQNQIRSLSRVAGSNQNVDARSDMHASPKNFSTVNSQKMLNVISAHDTNEVSAAYPGAQRISFQDAYMGAQSFDNSPQSKISPKPQTLDRLENSEAKYMDQREYNAQFYDSAPAYPGDFGSPKSDAKRRITFDVRNLGDIEECESPAQSKSLSRKMSSGESGRKGTEYASFRVSFGRTQSKYRSQSPDIDTKDSLYIVDVARRKRVTHHEQTYDIVQGNEVRYDLNSMGPDYNVSKGKPRSRYEPQSQNSLNNQSSFCEKHQNFSSPQGTYRVDNTPQK